MNTISPVAPAAPVRLTFKAQMLQAREDAIIQAVNRLLAEKGFDAMTVDEVAAEVGIAKASLYKHFPSKEDLACAAMVRVMHRAQAFLASLPQRAAPLDNLRPWCAGPWNCKLAGEMPSLPSQNSSLRATLIDKQGLHGRPDGGQRPARRLDRGRPGAGQRSTPSCPPLPCSTPCTRAPATRCWSSSRPAASTATSRSSIWS